MKDLHLGVLTEFACAAARSTDDYRAAEAMRFSPLRCFSPLEPETIGGGFTSPTHRQRDRLDLHAQLAAELGRR